MDKICDKYGCRSIRLEAVFKKSDTEVNVKIYKRYKNLLTNQSTNAILYLTDWSNAQGGVL